VHALRLTPDQPLVALVFAWAYWVRVYTHLATDSELAISEAQRLEIAERCYVPALCTDSRITDASLSLYDKVARLAFRRRGELCSSSMCQGWFGFSFGCLPRSPTG
jgi:hypothetical protein